MKRRNKNIVRSCKWVRSYQSICIRNLNKEINEKADEAAMKCQENIEDKMKDINNKQIYPGRE